MKLSKNKFENHQFNYEKTSDFAGVQNLVYQLKNENENLKLVIKEIRESEIKNLNKYKNK